MTDEQNDLADKAVEWLKDHGIVDQSRRELLAMVSAAFAVAGLTSGQQARVIRWLDDVYLGTHEIEEGEDIGDLVDQENSFPIARQIMNHHLRNDEGLRLGYRANIAMRLHDLLHEFGYKPKLKPEDRDSIAEQLIHLIFST